MPIIDLIAERRTSKVLADPLEPCPAPDGSERELMQTMLSAAHAAPHHFPCHEGHRAGARASEAPWRFYALDGAACRRLRERVTELDGPVETTLRLLGAADGLVVVTWLPELDGHAGAELDAFSPTRRNMEHIAAASAGVQNMLLVATEAGARTFWSSGGPILRSETVRGWLSVPRSEIMLAAVYLSAAGGDRRLVKPGSRRGRIGDPQSCTTWLDGASA